MWKLNQLTSTFHLDWVLRFLAMVVHCFSPSSIWEAMALLSLWVSVWGYTGPQSKFPGQTRWDSISNKQTSKYFLSTIQTSRETPSRERKGYFLWGRRVCIIQQCVLFSYEQSKNYEKNIDVNRHEPCAFLFVSLLATDTKLSGFLFYWILHVLLLRLYKLLSFLEI